MKLTMMLLRVVGERHMTKQFHHSTFRKEIHGFILLLLLLLLFGCNNEVTDIENVKYDIQFYQKLDGKISIEYPVLVGEEYSAINEVIYNEALFVLKYYGTTLPEKLCIKVTTFFQNDRYLNIVYEGTGQLDGESKVNRYKYTTVLDIIQGEKRRLSDLISIDDDFIKVFMENSKVQLLPELYEHLKNIGSDELYHYLITADRLELEIDKQKDVFSYISEDGLNIVFPFPSVAGDYGTVTIPGKITENGQFQIE